MHTFTRHCRGVSASLILGALAACGGGGSGGSSDGGDPTSPENLTASSLAILTDAPTIAYPLTATVEISSDSSASNVDISLFAIEKTDDSNAEAREIPLGSEIIPQVESGSQVYNLNLNIPSSVETAGQYYIVAVVDAAGTIAETDEEDNSVAIEVTLLHPPATNVHVVELALDRSALEISTKSYADFLREGDGAGDVYNADAGATLTVGAEGLETNATIDIQAFASLRIMRSDTGTAHDVPLYLWNGEEQRYINAYGVDPDNTGITTDIEWLPLGTFRPQLVTAEGEVTKLDDVDRNSALLNFYFPGKLGSVLEYAMRYAGRRPPGSTTTDVLSDAPAPTTPPPDLNATAINELVTFLRSLPHNGIYGDETAAAEVLDYAICVKIRATDPALGDYQEQDNERCSTLAITLPPLPVTSPGDPPVIVPPPPGYDAWRNRSTTAKVYSPKPFARTTGGKVLKASVDFGNSYRADHRGYVQQMHGHVPVWVFGEKFYFLKADVHAQLIADWDWQPDNVIEDIAGLPLSDLENISYVHAEIWHAGRMLSNTLVVPNNIDVSINAVEELTEISYSKELPDPDSNQILESTMFVGPIPLSAGAYVTGNLGIKYPTVQVRADPTADEDLSDDKFGDYFMGIEGGPFANLSGTVYAGLGSRRPVFPVIVGVESNLTLLDERIIFSDGVTIEGRVKDNEDDPLEFLISRGPKITNIFTGPRGAINLFVEYKVIRISTCKVGPIKIPCPKSRRVKVTKGLWKSPALFRFDDVLYSDPNLVLDVVLIEGEEPLYYE